MSQPLSRTEKLNAARKKLKEFQESKKVKEKHVALIENSDNPKTTTSSNNDEHFTNSLQQNANLVQYFTPTNNTTIPHNINTISNENDSTNSTNENVNDNNSNNVNNIQNYFNTDIVNNDNHSNNINSIQNYFNSVNQIHPDESYGKMYPNDIVQPSSNNIQNNTIDNIQNLQSPNDSSNVLNALDNNGSYNNTLTVFTDSSNNSSHASSANTGPFILNDSPQKISTEKESGGNEELLKNNSLENEAKDTDGSYQLFESTHNENYFGINFGNEGPGIHMNIHPFEHRNRELVTDFLHIESEHDHQDDIPESKQPTDSKVEGHVLDSQGEANKPINLLNDNFRRNLLSLSTSKSTSVEDYTSTDKSRGDSVSKSVSLESSNAINFDDMKPFRTDSNSSTVFSSCDNIRKLSSANESSSEPPCTNSQCEENFMIELEKRNEELSTFLANEQQKSVRLEGIINQLKNDVTTLQLSISNKDNYFQSSLQQYEQQMKSQTHTIQILIEEKNQLTTRVNSSDVIIEEKNKEIDELKGRLAISKHKGANIERDVNLMQDKIKTNNDLIVQLNATLAQERKQLDDLSEDKVELVHQLDTKKKELNETILLLKERDSQLSLLQLRVQQLNAAGGMMVADDMNGIKAMQVERDQLKHAVTELTENAKTLTRERDKTIQYYTQMIETLRVKLDETTVSYSSCQYEKQSLLDERTNQIQHISNLEKQIQSLREAVSVNNSGEDKENGKDAMITLVTDMENKIKDLTLEKLQLDNSLQAQVLENELAKEQIELLSREIEKLEGDRPDATALLSAMESDKIAASRAVQQNSVLKKQLEELQDAVVILNNSKLELTEQLQHETFKLKDLTEQLESLKQQPNDNERSDPVVFEQSIPVSADNEALQKLEEKFNHTMIELAELSDEKQRLEHLVTQLQLETETIGEYAALYQKQRYLLQQRSREKDEQVKKLSKEQEALKEKLSKLNLLVQDFVSNKYKESLLADQGIDLLNGDTTDLVEQSSSPPPADVKANQIMALISEIGSNSLIDNPNSFHPCLLCSGQLITV